MYYDTTAAVVNDDVKDALNYEEAMYCISEVIAGNDNYNLVETICNDILSMLMDKFTELQLATVRVRKLSVPVRRVIAYIEAEQTIERTN